MPSERSTDRPARALRVGVFGGAFDPPHLAHVALVKVALDSLQLDRLHILPTGRAWHKARALGAADDRLAMCELAFGHLAGVQVDRREIDRLGDSYTIDTLEELVRAYPGPHLFLIIGEDQLAAFRTWRRWQGVLELARLVVARRPPTAVTEGSPTAQPDDPQAVPHQQLAMPLSPISSTTIRSMAASGAAPQELAALVPEAVAGYISTHSLYQQPS